MQQLQQQPLPNLSTKVILDILETILVYKFPNLTRQEIADMFAISDLKKTKVYEEGVQEGREEKRLKVLAQERSLVICLLKRKVGELPKSTLLQVDRLSLMQLEDLAEALLDFGELADLDAWFGGLEVKRAEVLKVLTQRLGLLESSAMEQIEGLTLEQLGLFGRAATEGMTSEGFMGSLNRRLDNGQGA